jgi:LytS/YehU family sensor histidine kinase
LSYLRRYLKIEHARFEDRLTVEWAIDAAADAALIPPFILQPIVENAFRHGISHCTDASLLKVEAAVAGRTVRLSVYNDGPGVSEPVTDGYGLSNVRARLATRTPAGDLAIVNEAHGVRVTLTLPLLRAEDVKAAS